MIRSILILIIFFPGLLKAQTLIPTPTTLNFGDAFENQIDSLNLDLSNPLPYAVNVTDIRFFDTYSQPDFWVNTSSVVVPALGSYTLKVYFQPRHNISYNSEMLLLTDSNRGGVSVNLRGVGKYSLPYYNSTAGKSEQDLKNALNSLLGQNFVGLTYNTARDQLFMVIDNQKVNGQGAASNTLEGIYTGQQVVGYSTRGDAQNSGFNTEHIFPQSLFSQSLPMRADLYHLFPADAFANGQRGNLPFGVVSNPSWQQGGSKLGNGVFEPRDTHKGTVARAMMYFVLRYQDYSNFFAPQENILRQWNENFPPDTIARRRNEDIEAIQGNRNPFVDYPQLAERINSFTANSVAPIHWDIVVAESNIDIDTVGFPTQATYHLPIINAGNQTIQLSQISFAQGHFSFRGNSGNNANVAAGEARTIRIGPSSGAGWIDDTLLIVTNVPTSPLLKIPVKAYFDTSTPLEELAEPAVFNVWPNPAQSAIRISQSGSPKRTQYQLLSLEGRVLKSGVLEEQDGTIELSTISRGVYVLYIRREGKVWTQRLLLE